jgi:hypothetical protein
MIARAKRYRLVKRLVNEYLDAAIRDQRRRPHMARLNLTGAQGVLDAAVRCEAKAGFG